MALQFYENYLQNIYRNPNEVYTQTTQAFANSVWNNSTQTYYTILGQGNIGSGIYLPQEISVDMAIDLTTGMKKSDDWKIFTFKDLSTIPSLGLMYKYSDNDWIAVDTRKIGTVIKSLEVRRCNNILKWIDKNTNVLHEIPCILEYDDTSPRPQVNKDIITPNNGIVMIVQGNQDTVNLKVNQRFIFNGRPFKITGYNNYMQNDYVTQDTPLLFFDTYLDEIQPTDDLVNNIANRYEYNYQITILENPIENVKGFSGQLNAQVTLNDNVVDVPVVWSSNENGTIDSNGNYTLTGEVGTVATFDVAFGRTSNLVNINIVDVIVDNYEIIVSPNITEIKQNRTVNINAELYKNGVKQTDVVNATLSGADSLSCYTWTNLSVNNFALTNKMRSVAPLIITFTSGVITKSINIELNAMY